MICGYCGTELPDSALFCGECGRSLAQSGAAARRPRTAPVPVPAPVVEPVEAPAAEIPEPAPEIPEPAPEPEPDLDATRIVPPASDPTPSPAPRFVLQFSTGESVTVTGTGLVGRNPVAEPGEYFDHLVTIVDPGKSVSKTHLEFGQEDGEFWVSDRFSGNGSVARQPDGDPVRCDAGKRYRVPRGTRISIGEQFFVVS